MAAVTEDLHTSLVTTLGHEARIVRHAALAYTRARDRAGLDVVERALKSYYQWRIAQAAPAGSDLPAIVAGWRSADLLAINPQGWGELVVDPAGLRMRVTSSPELRHYVNHDVAPFAVVQYRSLAEALAEAVGMSGTGSAELRGEELVLTVGTPPGEGQRPGIPLEGQDGLDMLHATTESRGKLIVFLGRAADEAFGADGEAMFREAMREFGRERGESMRLRHLSAGLETNLLNIMNLYDSGGNTNVWQYRDEGTLTPTLWSQDCTHCPYVQPWKDLSGLRYGEIYDHEFHVAQFKAYRNDIEVRWGELQSRGDATCEFRFSIPSAARA